MKLLVRCKQHITAMIAFDFRNDDYVQSLLDILGDAAEKQPHITVLYLGETSKYGDDAKQFLSELLRDVASKQAPIQGRITGLAQFTEGDDGKYPVVLLFDSPQLPFFRVDLHRYFKHNGIDVQQDHGFIPHITLAYVNEPIQLDIEPKDVTLNNVSIWWGNEIVTYPMTGTIVEKQLPIGEGAKRALISARISIFQDEITDITGRMYTGEMSLGSYEEKMRAMIRELHSAVASISKGGWDVMTQSDWGKIGAPVRQQYRYLHGFMQDIADNRDTIPLGSIERRARMYGDAAGEVAILMQSADVREYLPWMPRDGSTECLVSCKCSWTKIADVMSASHKTRKITYRWDLHPAEHCPDCIDRDGHRVTFDAPAKIHAPQSIGGL